MTIKIYKKRRYNIPATIQNITEDGDVILAETHKTYRYPMELIDVPEHKKRVGILLYLDVVDGRLVNVTEEPI